MHCAANFEVIANVSVVADDKVLTVDHPKGEFKALIKNVPRTVYTTPFVLSVHIYFEAVSLELAEEDAERHLVSCLNMLAFAMGASVRRHRIRQIVDAEPPDGAMRSVRFWGDRIEYDDPQPFISSEQTRSIERLLEHDIPPAIRRALSWYRLGMDATVTDDQFTYFWFALEILAEFQKPSERVNDKCPKCQSALYCEECGTHPKHKPYPKQAIQSLLKRADKDCDDATVALLQKTRNSLMHGKTLREIESSLPDPHESIVDTLGHLLWRSLVLQFPPDFFDGSIMIGMPSTYVHYKPNAISHIQTMVPMDADGHFDLSFTGMKMEMKPFGPPQSALPFVVRLTPEMAKQLRALAYKKCDHQEMLERVAHQVREQAGQYFTLIIATDMVAIRSELSKEREGDWQELFRQFIETAEVAQ